MKKSIRIRPILICMVIIFAVISVYAFHFRHELRILEDLELKTIDLRFKLREKRLPGPETILAVVDDKSIAKEGRWVWPRHKFARLIDVLSDAGAKVIAFDVGFLEVDENDKWRIETLNTVEKKIAELGISEQLLQNFFAELKKQADNDTILAESISNSNAEIVLGYFFHTGSEEPLHMEKDEIFEHEGNIMTSMYHRAALPSDNGFQLRFQAKAPQSNIRKISDAVSRSGFFNMFQDADGTVRKIPCVVQFKDGIYAPLSLMTLSAYLETPLAIEIDGDGNILYVGIGDWYIPTDDFGQMMVNYRGKKETFTHVSVTDILNGRVSKKMFEGRIVLVGVTAEAVYDLRVTPFDNVFPGLEVHANIVDNILSGDFIYPYETFIPFNLLAIITAGLMLGLVLPHTRLEIGTLFAVCLFLGYIQLCQYLFAEKGIILNMIYPLFTIIAVYTVITAYRYLVESNQKKFIKDAFATYLAPSVVRQLIESPEKLVLGGEERVVTAFFSDVQGFTSISEKLEPASLVELLNQFLTEMTDIILKYEGTVDKFEGDAIIAFFGAPNELENQEETACRTCIEMQKRLEGLRKEWRERKMPELFMRIGLLTGPAVVGNMGSKNRMDYTMMGDTVNTAARLEGVNKIYRTYTMTGEKTFNAVKEKFQLREIDSILVVGKKTPVRIFELIGYKEEIGQDLKSMLDHYSKGLAAYRKQDWEEAVKAFDHAQKIVPDDGPSAVMSERCREYLVNSPDPEWNGAYVMTSK
ncbi:CHASE2 domain-containing protein [Desulfobacterales bacterium HSG16]|nr:CHASE2 domain-containing protein [Desulfobacterales bacterium HSG16]